MTNSQIDTTNESQEVSPFPAGDHKVQLNRRAQRHSKHKTEQKHKRSTKEVPPWNGPYNILLEGLNQFNGAPTSLLIHMWIKTHRYLVCMKDPYMFTMDVKPVSRIYKTFILLLYEEVLNCPALRSPKPNSHQQFNRNNLTHTRIPLQLFAQFVAEPVTFGSHGSSVHV